MIDCWVLGFAALFSEMIDAVVGGGGLIQIPTLFSVLSNAMSATLLGTNKLAGIWGTCTAAFRLSRRIRLEWSTAGPAATAAFIAAFIGAYTVIKLPADFIRKLLPLILLAVAIYTFREKEFGAVHALIHTGSTERYLAIAVGSCIGFYDGFFGPGMGSFLIFLFIRFFGFDFLGASVVAKVVNIRCNLAALM